eukprot:233133-Amphidinium_carterae.1
MVQDPDHTHGTLLNQNKWMPGSFVTERLGHFRETLSETESTSALMPSSLCLSAQSWRDRKIEVHPDRLSFSSSISSIFTRLAPRKMPASLDLLSSEARPAEFHAGDG